MKNLDYNDNALKIKLKIDSVKGENEPLRDWPLFDEKYIVLKVKDNVDELYINGYKYTKI